MYMTQKPDGEVEWSSSPRWAVPFLLVAGVLLFSLLLLTSYTFLTGPTLEECKSLCGSSGVQNFNGIECSCKVSP